MGLFKRVVNLMKKSEPLPKEKGPLELDPGDIVEVSLVTYEVTGRTRNSHRNAVLLTLRDGNDVRYLYIEERERVVYQLYQTIDGRLDTFNEVPTEIEMDDGVYYLEEQFTGHVTTAGQTPFQQAGELYVWQFQSDDRKLLRIEWQDGRFMMYEGEDVLPADVQVIRGN